MIEIFKNKAIIGLFILMLGFTYIKCIPTNNLEDTDSSSSEIVYENH